MKKGYSVCLTFGTLLPVLLLLGTGEERRVNRNPWDYTAYSVTDFFMMLFVLASSATELLRPSTHDVRSIQVGYLFGFALNLTELTMIGLYSLVRVLSYRADPTGDTYSHIEDVFPQTFLSIIVFIGFMLLSIYAFYGVAPSSVLAHFFVLRNAEGCLMD